MFTTDIGHPRNQGAATAIEFASPPSEPDRRPADARHFDFLLGSWDVRNRTLRERLKGSTEWTEWNAVLDVVPILGGYGNVDRFRAIRAGLPYEGVTVRLFDPATHRWSLSWIDNRTFVILPQVDGPMEEWGGEFRGQELFEGDSVALRFRWTHTAPDRAYWEQAYQRPDGSWEVNWTMDFERRRTAE